jgi:iron complex outermembrane receptor protein
MDYANQLVPTGKLNDVGAAIRANVANSYRAGIEVDGGIRFSPKFSWIGNVTLSQNKIKEFVEVMYDYGAAFDEFNEQLTVYKNTDIAFSPNWIGGSNLVYQPFKNFEAALLSKYVGRQFLDNTSNSSRVINSYFVNDLRLSYSWKPNFMRELSVSCLVNNVFNELYSSNGYTYGYFAGPSETRQNYFYPQAGRNFLVMVAMRF